MENLFDFTEDWCQRYKPIQHTTDGHNKRFFLTTGFMGMADFLRGSDINKSPSIIMETNVEGEIGDFDVTNYTIYCAVRATDQRDGNASKLAILEAKHHLKKLIAYMRVQKRMRNKALEGVNPEQPLHYQSEGPMYDGWHLVFFSIEEVKKYSNLCIDTNDYIDVKPYSGMTDIAPLLHKIDFDGVDYGYAYDWFRSRAAGIGMYGMCSSVRVGNFYGRNLDWFETEMTQEGQPQFVVTTKADKTRLGVKGMASCGSITEGMAQHRTDDEIWKILPFFLQDGRNSEGLFCNINVVPTDKGDNRRSVPAVELRDEVCSIMLVRYILDRFSNAEKACRYIRDHVAVYAPDALQQMHYESHWMIGDRQKTFVLEIVEGRAVYQECDTMTNFFINGVTPLDGGKVYTNADADEGNLPTSLGITPYGSGLERWNIIAEGKASAASMEGMRGLMNSLMYSRAYDLDTDPYWYSEFVSRDREVTVDTHTDNEDLISIINAAQEIKRGEREGRLWTSTHSVVYDLNSGAMNVVAFGDTENEWEL